MASILLFDSGVGGLSVYREIHKALPGQHYFYLFDNAFFPYGELSEPQLVARVEQLFADFCARHRVDIAVIACNTASTHVLPALRRLLSIPVVGVVPAIKPAAEHSRRYGRGRVGLLATPGTVSRRYTADLIRDFAADLDVSLIGTSDLVRMAEEKVSGKRVDLARLAEVLAPWRSANGPDTVVLGCTHFPLLLEELQQLLPGVTFVDSGAAIARRVGALLASGVTHGETTDPAPSTALFCTRLNDRARAQARIFEHEGLGPLRLFEPGHS
ncbi:glutamate racemase [Zobellella taiwanensis]|uniref:Glutamate racemase n=1 Tax=Zobellella taiwanensis TaxID=347535 RepID=A0A2P7QY16_9GAMM|nr:glutamate racemase [Zobellella taiwanensis]PSJ42839.1 glutamate racemase [Zobellella taiwanensis]